MTYQKNGTDHSKTGTSQSPSGVSRRNFLQYATGITAGSLVLGQILAPEDLLGSPASAAAANQGEIELLQDGDTIRVKTNTYEWEWSQSNDLFRLTDARKRLVTTGPLQPAVVVIPQGGVGHQCSAGKFSSKSVTSNKLSVTYTGVNKHATVTVTWRFDALNLWTEPFTYTTPVQEDVVSVHHFAKAQDTGARPSLEQSYLVVPGMSESSSISPILPAVQGIDSFVWLGHGGDSGTNMQQWGLPVHYFCGASSAPGLNSKNCLTEGLSDAFCCGLSATVPADLMLKMQNGSCSIVLNVRSDLWGHSRGPGALSLGAGLCWSVGRDYREAIRHYYLALVTSGIIKKKVNSAKKNAVVTAPAFDTWGEETATNKTQSKFDQALLISMYESLKSAGMRPGTFIIDQKWEGNYGSLVHSEEKFPDFEKFLKRLGDDGFKLGMWAAFIRCDDPAAVGLNLSHMLRGVDGKPITKQEMNRDYYLYDFTQPEVERVLTERVRQFARRYKPVFVKFDFGYELPSLSLGAPKDMAWAGERLLEKGVAIIVDALHSVDPDIVVMYYSLSPLFIKHFDLHSPDDMFLCSEDYQSEANRRFFFSGLLGEIGMPTFSSTGYDWLSVCDIWFDAAAIGCVSSLNSFDGDELGSGPTPLRIAKFNGISNITRSTNVFTVEPLDPVLIGSTSGAHSSSWVRLEDGEPVLVALRSRRFDGSIGHDHYEDIVKSNASLIVSSKSAMGLRETRKLGVVPYGDGEATICHKGTATSAQVTTHCLKKGPRKEVIPIHDGLLRFPLKEQLADGSVVEWIEIDLV